MFQLDSDAVSVLQAVCSTVSGKLSCASKLEKMCLVSWSPVFFTCCKHVPPLALAAVSASTSFERRHHVLRLRLLWSSITRSSAFACEHYAHYNNRATNSSNALRHRPRWQQTRNTRPRHNATASRTKSRNRRHLHTRQTSPCWVRREARTTMCPMTSR